MNENYEEYEMTWEEDDPYNEVDDEEIEEDEDIYWSTEEDDQIAEDYFERTGLDWSDADYYDVFVD